MDSIRLSQFVGLACSRQLLTLSGHYASRLRAYGSISALFTDIQPGGRLNFWDVAEASRVADPKGPPVMSTTRSWQRFLGRKAPTMSLTATLNYPV